VHRSAQVSELTMLTHQLNVSELEVESACIPQEFGTCDPEAKIRESTLVEDQFV
jgi:hypothetical protein